MRNFSELLQEQSKRYAEKVYLIFQDRQFTFAELNQKVNQVAQGLAELGVGKGGRVALLVKNSPEFILAWWAVFRLGAVMVPINLRLTAKEVAYILNHSQAQTVVLGGQSLDLLPDLRRDCPQVRHWLGVDAGEALPALEDFLKLPGELAPVAVDLEDDAAILYTSGTTGFPKGVVHSQGNYLHTGASFARTTGLKESDRLLTANPLFHVNAQFYSCLGTLYKGATFVLAEKFSASRMWDWARRYNTNKMVLLLPLATILYNREPRPDDADNPVELVVAGGAPKGHYRDFEKRFGVRLQTLYSLTESPLGLMGVLDEPVKDGSVGVPMIPDEPGQKNQARIFDDQDQELPPGETGWIVLRNQALLKRYLDDPQATAEVLKGGWLHSGDRGQWDEQGWFFFLGRGKDVIRKKGENISALEVETVLNAAPGVAEAAVIGVTPPDAVGEEEIMAFVVRDRGAAPDWGGIIAHCEANLADFKVPRFWKEAAELPKNATNRVVKDRLSDSESPEAMPGVFDRQQGERGS
jgi:acyl-CoA synthetase (AMP-forming)/AMP-acid ligase II